MSQSRGPETLGKVLASRRIGRPPNKRQRLDLIRNNWKTLAGERLSEHTRPSALVRKTLVIAADGSAWASEISLLSEEILRKACVILGDGVVERVRVKTRPGAPGRSPDEGDDRPSGPPVENRDSRPVTAAGIEEVGDPEVREALLRLMRTSRPSRPPGDPGNVT